MTYDNSYLWKIPVTGLDKDVKMKLFKDFVKDEQDLQRQESLEENKEGVLMTLTHPETKAKVTLTPAIVQVLKSTMTKAQERKLQTDMRCELIKHYGPTYKKYIDSYLKKEEAKLLEKFKKDSKTTDELKDYYFMEHLILDLTYTQNFPEN